MMSRDQIFIVSWYGQHINAQNIARSLEEVDAEVLIVYSDPDPAFEPRCNATFLRCDNRFYFGDKLQACLDAFNGERMMVIHADCSCDDWPALVSKGLDELRSNPQTWVWAPKIDYTGFSPERTGVLKIEPSGLTAVVQTDTIVYAWSRNVVQRLQRSSFAENKYGWGVGWMASAFAYAHDGWVVVDESLLVRHPRSRGYDSHEALRQRNLFLLQLTVRETFICRLLDSHMMMKDVLRHRRSGVSA